MEDLSVGADAIWLVTKANQTVKIRIIDGVAYVESVPAGVIVEITDYDVDAETKELDAEGRPCSSYSVTSQDIKRWTTVREGARIEPDGSVSYAIAS